MLLPPPPPPPPRLNRIHAVYEDDLFTVLPVNKLIISVENVTYVNIDAFKSIQSEIYYAENVL